MNGKLFVTAICAGASLFALSGCGSFDLAEKMGAGEFTKVYDIAGDYKTLDLKTNVADVAIQTGETPTMEVHMDKWYKMEDVTEQDTLYLTEKNDGPFWQKWFHFSSVHNRVILTLPDGYVERLILSADVGDVKISGLVTDQLSLEADTGKVEIEDVAISSISADLDTGNLKMTGVSADILDLETDTGLIKVAGAVTESLQAESDTGDTEISGLKSDIVRIISDTGDIQSEITGGTDINLESDTGDIKLTVSGSQNDYNYQITNNVGDISIGESHMGGSNTSYIVSNNADKDIVISNDTGAVAVRFFE